MKPIKLDFHTHSEFSNDSTAPMEHMVLEAINRGITDYAFTDHIDYDYDEGAEISDWDFDIKQYFKTIDNLQLKYSERIKLYKGIEFGVQPHLSQRMEKLVDEHAFDFVIASQHTVDGTDLYNKKYFEKRCDAESIRHYYEMYDQCAKMTNHYSVLGHLDLYVRYKKELVNFDITNYFDILESTFKHLAYREKGLEINAGGYKYGLGINNPTWEILNFFKENGGEVITLGSDAHTTEYIGYMHRENLEKLDSMGFKYICTFKEMKAIYHSIKACLSK